MYAVHGILFNHEGTKRGEEFVTRKITKNVARIKRQLSDPELKITPMELGNLDAKRDWSDSEDFVRGVWLMLNQEDSERRDEFNKAFEELWENYKNYGVALGGSDIEGISENQPSPLSKITFFLAEKLTLYVSSLKRHFLMQKFLENGKVKA